MKSIFEILSFIASIMIISWELVKLINSPNANSVMLIILFSWTAWDEINEILPPKR